MPFVQTVEQEWKKVEFVRLIDADALLEKSYCISPATMSNPYGGPLVVNEEDIEDAPTIIWPRQAKWIDVNPDEYLDARMKCSNCNHIEMPIVTWNYCPYCGAKMEE